MHSTHLRQCAVLCTVYGHRWDTVLELMLKKKKRPLRFGASQLRERRVNPLPLAQERSRGLLLCEGFRDKAAATRAKARISHPKMRDTSRLLSSQGRECVSSATSLDTLDRIALRGRNPKVMGHHNPNHQWDMHRHSLFLLTPTCARGIGISPRVLHQHLLFYRRATWAKAWVKVKDRSLRLGIQGPRGVST